MTITLSPEHERIIQAQMASGQFRSVDEVLDKALAPLRPQADVSQAANLIELFAPVRGLLTDEEIDSHFNRNPSSGRPVDLG